MAHESLRAALEIHLIIHDGMKSETAFFADNGRLYRLKTFRELRDNFSLLNFEDVGKGEIVPLVDHPDLHN